MSICAQVQVKSQVFDLESQVKSQVSYGGNECSSAAFQSLCLAHSIAISKEFKGCTGLQVVMQITRG